MQVIQIQNLSKSFGSEQAVKNFSIEVGEAEVFAFLGSNGSGKTTTIRCLLGIYTPDAGTALIDGRSYDSSMNSFVGYLPEERGLYTKVAIKDLFYYFGELRGLSRSDVSARMDEYLERVGLGAHKHKKVMQLSSGMQQKVQIGVTILHRPKLLVLDEPFKGLDPLNRQLFIDIFRELKDKGTTIMYSTHVVDEAQRLADRVVMIKKGERVLYGTVDEVRSSSGSVNIHIEFSGNLPVNPKLYTATSSEHTAELVPAKGVNAQEIIKFLVGSGVVLSEFKLDRPSLQEIFITKAKSDEK